MNTAVSALEEIITTRLQQLDAHGQLRTLRANHYRQSGVIDLSHNDYLGLRSDQEWQTKVWQGCRELPVGSGGSRLLGGEFTIFQNLEIQFAQFKGAEGALFFPSGYAANISCLAALAVQLADTHFFSDQLNHASIIDGFRLAKIGREKRTIYRHLDLTDLERGLQASRAKINVIVTESLFSMDGDICDLKRLLDLAREYRGILLIDEAHAVGVRGEEGAGLIAEKKLHHADFISVNTCGKALGVAGAFVCGPAWFVRYLINMARHFIYTTAPSPWLALALQKSIDHVKMLTGRRQTLADYASRLRKELGLKMGATWSHIVPLIAADSRQALRWSDFLATQGIIVRAIRPPTVPTARLRLSLHAGLQPHELEKLLITLKKLARLYRGRRLSGDT